MPITWETLRTTKGVSASYKLINCYGQDNSISEYCVRYVNEEAYCCSINVGDHEHTSRSNDEFCGGIEHGAVMARVSLNANRRAIFENDSQRLKASEINRYCCFDTDRRYTSSKDRTNTNDERHTKQDLYEKLSKIDDLSTDHFARAIKRIDNRVPCIEADKNERRALSKQIHGNTKTL